MRNIVKMKNHYVVRGMSIREYGKLVNLPTNVWNYEDLCTALKQREEDPLWDFCLEELEERENNYYFVELYDKNEPRYFETLIPIGDPGSVLAGSSDLDENDDLWEDIYRKEAWYRLTQIFEFSKEDISDELYENTVDAIREIYEDWEPLGDALDDRIQEVIDEYEEEDYDE